MKPFAVRLVNLVFGLILYSLGIVFSIKANIGYAPWEVFHVGLASKAGFSIGTASILTGIVVVAVIMFFGEKIGLVRGLKHTIIVRINGLAASHPVRVRGLKPVIAGKEQVCFPGHTPCGCVD